MCIRDRSIQLYGRNFYTHKSFRKIFIYSKYRRGLFYHDAGDLLNPHWLLRQLPACGAMPYGAFTFKIRASVIPSLRILLRKCML